MSLRINTNLASINAQRNLDVQQKRNVHAMKALSSGSRITQASDDAAGLAISEKLRADVKGMQMARRNAENAISFIQVGEGGLNEVNNILVRLRELGVQSASDTVGEEERGFIDMEAQHLLQEVDRIAKTTKFGEKNLLDGSMEELEFQVGVDGSENSRISFNLQSNATASNLAVDGLEFDSKSGARDALDLIDEAIVKVGGMRANFGAFQNRIDSAIANIDVQSESLSAANSRIRDADIAHETAELASSQILQQASVGMLAQANQSSAAALQLLG
ncbi:MAG: flagellin FliC [Bdellovibrionaceae bacterium]|nr:flagellin FliC [Pseudobdellovibrionaceae bacterium]